MNTSSPNPLLDEERRTSMRSAFEVADHLTELAPIPPTEAKVQRDCARGWSKLGVVLHFDGGDSVAKFAEIVGVTPVVDLFEFGGDWYRESEAVGVLAGVPFRAWNWTKVNAAEVKHLSEKQVAA